jgi:poly-gamma-glutamate capsule biosynthesis protein CapA/YwtB (metallophosphatase superfamily)
MMLKFLFFYLQFFTAVWPREADTVKTIFLGDIMQHQSQLEAALRPDGNKDSSSHYDYSRYFMHLKDNFKKAHIVAANIETTFAPPPYSGYPAFNSPPALLKECAESGINLFLAANNHSADKGSRGLKGAIKLYKQLGLPYTGIYSDKKEAKMKHPLIIEKNNIKIAILNYTYGTNGIGVPPPFVVNTMDTSKVKSDLNKAKRHNPDFIISCMHWGEEYKLSSSAKQREWEQFLYKHGTNLIIGAHPHVPQEINIQRDSLGKIKYVTAFSLGNSISNMTARNTRIGIMLEINLIKEKQTSRTIIEEPVIHWIWTSRPASTGGYYTIISIKDYLDNSHKYKLKGEKSLIKTYHNSFSKRFVKTD